MVDFCENCSTYIAMFIVYLFWAFKLYFLFNYQSKTIRLHPCKFG